MSIISLIKKLEELRAQVGNVTVEVRNPAGDHDTLEDVQLVNTSDKPRQTRWVVSLDT